VRSKCRVNGLKSGDVIHKYATRSVDLLGTLHTLEFGMLIKIYELFPGILSREDLSFFFSKKVLFTFCIPLVLLLILLYIFFGVFRQPLL